VSSEGETVQGGETPNTWAKVLNDSPKLEGVISSVHSQGLAEAEG